MFRIAVIGSPDSVIGFKALGLDVFPVDNASAASDALKETADSMDPIYAIIYIEETMAAEIMPEVNRYKDQPVPAVILIPGRDGPIGLGQSALKQAVEKAVGSDIL